MHPISLTTPRNTFIAPRNDDLFVCRRAILETTLTCDCSWLFCPIPSKPFTSGLHFLGIPGNSLSAHKKTETRPQKNCREFPPSNPQCKQRVAPCTGCPRPPACSTNRSARLLGWFRHRSGAGYTAPASRVLSARHVTSFSPTWPARVVGDASSCHFAKLCLASLVNLSKEILYVINGRADQILPCLAHESLITGGILCEKRSVDFHTCCRIWLDIA